MQQRWGIKVPISLDNHGEYTDWLWVTRGDSKFQIEPILFDTQQQAQAYAAGVWGDAAVVEVYDEDSHGAGRL